ncbi:hypothetical protein BOX15_Mlig019726g2, partial [Macrostomum lignano]
QIEFMDTSIQLAGLAVAPGDRICRADDAIIAGQGTHEYQNWIHSSLLGRVQMERDGAAASADGEQHETETASGKAIVRVESHNRTFPSSMIDAIVVAQVVRVTNRVAHCTLLACNRVKLHPGFKAQIRREDVRATERDRVELADCFRAGDIVQARVLTLGQNGAYLLTTAQNELGVVVASGQHGSKLVPVSWNEMRCPITGQVYKRKVANVPEEFVKVFIEYVLKQAELI